MVIETLKQIIRTGAFHSSPKEMPSAEAYDLWADNYDAQPGNLMLDLDKQVFAELLNGLDLKDKQVADIGCGTGRHWPKLYQQHPKSLTGFDVSQGMLNHLQQKFLLAETYQITDNLFSSIPDATYDVVIATLTVAHIENIEEALNSWSRILNKAGDIIITDFHPNALAAGGKRTFAYNKSQIAVKNFVHFVYHIEEILLKNNFRVVGRSERIVDESVKHYYEAKNALPVYERFKDSRIIYGLHLTRS